LDITIPNISNVDSILVDSDFVKGNGVNPRLLREEAVTWDLHTGLDIFDGLVGFSFSERAIVRIS
jgi:hypothetical protein